MALARPLRVLLLAAFLAWCFFLYHIFRPSQPIRAQGPSLEKIERDPNLDRTSRPPSPGPQWPSADIAFAAQLPTSPWGYYIAPQTPTFRAPRTRTVSMPRCWRW